MIPVAGASHFGRFGSSAMQPRILVASNYNDGMALYNALCFEFCKVVGRPAARILAPPERSSGESSGAPSRPSGRKVPRVVRRETPDASQAVHDRAGLRPLLLCLHEPEPSRGPAVAPGLAGEVRESSGLHLRNMVELAAAGKATPEDARSTSTTCSCSTGRAFLTSKPTRRRRAASSQRARIAFRPRLIRTIRRE